MLYTTQFQHTNAVYIVLLFIICCYSVETNNERHAKKSCYCFSLAMLEQGYKSKNQKCYNTWMYVIYDRYFERNPLFISEITVSEREHTVVKSMYFKHKAAYREFRMEILHEFTHFEHKFNQKQIRACCINKWAYAASLSVEYSRQCILTGLISFHIHLFYPPFLRTVELQMTHTHTHNLQKYIINVAIF